LTSRNGLPVRKLRERSLRHTSKLSTFSSMGGHLFDIGDDSVGGHLIDISPSRLLFYGLSPLLAFACRRNTACTYHAERFLDEGGEATSRGGHRPPGDGSERKRRAGKVWFLLRARHAHLSIGRCGVSPLDWGVGRRGRLFLAGVGWSSGKGIACTHSDNGVNCHGIE
jgi:hypothetical protein